MNKFTQKEWFKHLLDISPREQVFYFCGLVFCLVYMDVLDDKLRSDFRAAEAAQLNRNILEISQCPITICGFGAERRVYNNKEVRRDPAILNRMARDILKGTCVVP